MSIAGLSLVLWLGIYGDQDPASALIPQLDALTEFASEIDRRLAETGAGGLEAAVTLYDRVRRVLDAVSYQDIERMSEQVAHLQHELASIAGRLAALRDLKTTLDRVG